MGRIDSGKLSVHDAGKGITQYEVSNWNDLAEAIANLTGIDVLSRHISEATFHSKSVRLVLANLGTVDVYSVMKAGRCMTFRAKFPIDRATNLR
jgi:hypothetical protein